METETKKILEDKIKNGAWDKETKEKFLDKIKNSNLGKKRLYGIRDDQMGFQNVFIGDNDGVVYRDIYTQYQTALKSNMPNPMITFPDNFSLWAVAEIDEEHGQVKSVMVKLINLKKLIELYS